MNPTRTALFGLLITMCAFAAAAATMAEAAAPIAKSAAPRAKAATPMTEVSSPQIVATTPKVQLSAGEEFDFTITATFLDGDGSLYTIALDESHLPDGFKVLDTGDSQQLASAAQRRGPADQSQAVVSKTRYYKFKAIEPGIWLLPKAKLVLAADPQKSYGETSPIYTIVSPAGQSASTQPFFRQLPPTPMTKGGELMPFYQISAIAPHYQVVLWRLAVLAVAVAALAVAASAWSQRRRQRPKAAKKPKVTVAELRSELDDAGYRDRSPEQIKESYDAVRGTLISYAQHILGRDISAVRPSELIAQQGFVDGAQRQRFGQVLSACDAVRFCPERLAVRDKLAETVAAAKAAVIDPVELSPAPKPRPGGGE